MQLVGKHIQLRALEPEDLDFVHAIENDTNFWSLSNTQTPFSKYIIKQYIEASHRDIFEVKQLRLVIALLDGTAIGLVDLFDFDFINARAGIGIIIQSDAHKRKGYGKESIELLTNYCFTVLNLHQVYCNINASNLASIKLFSSLNFKKMGVKKDWNLINGQFEDEYAFQLLKT
jgi:diamine N-acetyltransferase